MSVAEKVIKVSQSWCKNDLGFNGWRMQLDFTFYDISDFVWVSDIPLGVNSTKTGISTIIVLYHTILWKEYMIPLRLSISIWTNACINLEVLSLIPFFFLLQISEHSVLVLTLGQVYIWVQSATSLHILEYQIWHKLSGY